MKIYVDGYPCVLRQALEAARLAGAGEQLQETVLQRELTLPERNTSSLAMPLPVPGYDPPCTQGEHLTLS